MPLKDVQEEVLKGRMLSIGLGTRLQTQLGRKGDELKVASVLVGIVPEEYFMIRVPPVPGILSKMVEGGPIIVRYVYSGNVYGFSSTILSYILKPAMIIFMAYPTTVEMLNLRKAQRLECLLPTVIKLAAKQYRGVILDISTGGCRVYTEYDESEYHSIDIESNIELSFQLTGTVEDQVIAGKIQNVRKDNKLAEMGIQFDSDNTTIIENVKEYIDNFFKLPFLPMTKPDTLPTIS